MQLFNLTIITPSGKIFDNKVIHVSAPGQEGSFGVLAKHAPMLAILKPGSLKVDEESTSTLYDIGDGVLEVAGNNTVTVLCSEASVATEKLPKEKKH